MKNVNHSLEELYKKVNALEKIEIHLKGVYQRIKAKEKLLETITKELDESAETISRLERMSIRSLFKKVLGNKEQQLEKERQAYLLKVLKHKGYTKSLQAFYFEVNVLEQKLEGKAILQKKLKELVRQKLRLLKKKDAKTADQIIYLENQVYAFKCQKKEIKEAIKCGDKVATALSGLEKALANIIDWGSGTFSKKSKKQLSYLNKKQLKKYKVDILKVNVLLEKLEEELEDISSQYDLDYKNFVHTFSGFLDDIYDGLISDWVIQNKIKNSMNETLSVQDKVQRIIAMLEVDATKTTELIAIKEKELQSFIVEF